MNKTSPAVLVKEEALRLGFNACGISRAEPLEAEASLLDQWLASDYHASMKWMKEHRDMRGDPRLLVDGASSVISVIHSYYTQNDDASAPETTGRVSRYAANKDYHKILRKKLVRLLEWMNENIGPVNGRAFVDSAPVMDKVWAQRAGLGWIGKHSNLLNKSLGSYFFIGELIVDIELETDAPVADHCGSCTRCIDACPTDAIVQPYVVDANKCISYVTIEHTGNEITDDLRKDTGNWIFGCDICQEVCPWNKFSVETSEERFRPVDDRMTRSLEDWLGLQPEEYDTLFAGSAIKRTGYVGFMRNVNNAWKTLQESRLEEH